jgi:nicotinic acid mononucleotide adenylyltransferase
MVDAPAFAKATAVKPADTSAGSQTSILLVDAPTSPVSSTDVRAAIARGASLEGLLPVVVANYIVRHGLYQHAREDHESGKEPHEDTVTPAS